MHVAFYAPMKPPDDPVPSGDRTMARSLVRAITLAGATVDVASILKIHAKVPDDARLSQLVVAGEREAARVVRAVAAGARRRPDVWFTYHLYYKSPDLVGPLVASALAIPYIAAEASYAPRRNRDAWASWQRHAATGMAQASAILCLTQRDKPCLAPVVGAHTRLVDLPPFLDSDGRTQRDHTAAASGSEVRLVTVAMMRDGAKLRSYRHLADALQHVRSSNWRLDVVGDGDMGDEVRAALAGAGGDRVVCHGALPPDAVAEVLESADAMVWPGFDEAFGMTYLEAQAHGVGVVAVACAGVPEVVADGETGLLAHADATPREFAGLIDRVIGDPELRRHLGEAARRRMVERHSLASASRIVAATLEQAIVEQVPK